MRIMLKAILIIAALLACLLVGCVHQMESILEIPTLEDSDIFSAPVEYAPVGVAEPPAPSQSTQPPAIPPSDTPADDRLLKDIDDVQTPLKPLPTSVLSDSTLNTAVDQPQALQSKIPPNEQGIPEDYAPTGKVIPQIITGIPATITPDEFAAPSSTNAIITPEFAIPSQAHAIDISSQSDPSQTTEPPLERPNMIVMYALIALILVLVFLVYLFLHMLMQKSQRLRDLGARDIESAKLLLSTLQNRNERITEEIEEKQRQGVASFNTQNTLFESRKRNMEAQISELGNAIEKLEKTHQAAETKVANQQKRLVRIRELYTSIEHSITQFHTADIPIGYHRPLTREELKDLDSIAPSVMLTLNCMNYQNLRKEFTANQKQIEELFKAYENLYKIKSNQAVYQMIVMALRSELQNVLINLKHDKIEVALVQIKEIVNKYLAITSSWNQHFAGTMRKFLGELEHLFTNAVHIEYEYYVKREQARQEQLAIRQRMHEEAEERRRLKEQERQIAQEEEKYHNEIAKLELSLASEAPDSQRSGDIAARIEQLQHLVVQVDEKRAEIVKLQNGKAGNVYVISNLGSFGDHVFKVGMTRRLNPQERIDELGSASVPFTFDVHCLIFSDDAVGLEDELHRRLHEQRLNKVNHRKEFFDISLEELERLVFEIHPSAEFNRTMLAEDYRQSLSIASGTLEEPADFHESFDGAEDDVDEDKEIA